MKQKDNIQTDLYSGSEVKDKHEQNWCLKLINKIANNLTKSKRFFVSNFTIYHEILPMVHKLEQIEKYMIEVRQELEQEIDIITKELDMYKNIVETMAKQLPDMFWLKLKDGTYKIANDEIKAKLLLDDNPIGKNDIELATAAKRKYGEENHTFGEKCANSDAVVMESLKRQRFLESGKVKGKMLYIEVYKAPLIINDEFIGVFGAGRDMTEYVEAYLEQREIMEKHFPGITTKFDNIFTKYSFQSEI